MTSCRVMHGGGVCRAPSVHDRCVAPPCPATRCRLAVVKVCSCIWDGGVCRGARARGEAGHAQQRWERQPLERHCGRGLGTATSIPPAVRSSNSITDDVQHPLSPGVPPPPPHRHAHRRRHTRPAGPLRPLTGPSTAPLRSAHLDRGIVCRGDERGLEGNEQRHGCRRGRGQPQHGDAERDAGRANGPVVHFPCRGPRAHAPRCVVHGGHRTHHQEGQPKALAGGGQAGPAGGCRAGGGGVSSATGREQCAPTRCINGVRLRGGVQAIVVP